MEVFWSKGTTSESRIGPPVFSIEAKRGVGLYGPVNVPYDRLTAPPPEATHLIVVADLDNLVAETTETNNTQAVADVKVSYGPDAKPLLNLHNIDLVKRLLRESGQGRAVITSTSRLPSEQARAMFDNLFRGTSPNYAAPGLQVVKVYRTLTRGLTLSKISARRDAIVNAMEAKILEVGPNNVSKHCNTEQGYASYQVFDIGPTSSGFSASTRRLFVAAVQRAQARGEVNRFLHPGNSNDPAFHFEIGTPST